MKYKILLLVAVLTLGITSNSFGAAAAPGWLDRGTDGSVTFTGGTNGLPNLIVKPSANVFLAWGVETTGVAYVIGTIHTSGTFTYATTSTDTNIYRYANTSQTSSSATTYDGSAQLPPSSPADATTAIAWGAGWTASK